MKAIYAAALAALLTTGSPASAAVAAPPPAAAKAAACCRVPAGTLIQVELAEPIGTKTHKAGDAFAIRLSEPLVAQGRIVAPAGAKGVGVVIDASKPGLGGKAAKIVLAAKYVQQGRVRIPLRALQISSNGRNNANTANVVGIGGIAFAPLGFAAMAIHGDDVALPAGTSGMAKVAAAVTLPSLGPAVHAPTHHDPSAALQQGPVHIGAPPRGKGQVVFFRAGTLLGAGQWFNVREDGKALGKLTNGAFFIQTEGPGQHTYTASSEPEFKDKLTLQVDPGETYFVEGLLTKGVVIGAADLTPSDSAAFEKAYKSLKPSPPVTPDKPKGAVSR